MRTERVDVLHPLHLERDDAPPPPRPTERPTTVVPFRAATRLPPADPQGAAFERDAVAAQTWERLERAHPGLAAKLPEFCRTPTSKLLYVVASRELSTLTGPLSVSLGPTDTIRRTASGGLELRGAGASTLRLHDREGDFSRLLLGAQRNAAAGTGPFDTLASSVESLLGAAVRDFHANPEFTGGGEAASARGGRAFRYTTFTQVLVSNDRTQRGFECLAAAAFHLYLSMGLVPADATREEIERRYTAIHPGHRSGGPRLGPEFTRSLRGGPARNPGERRLDAAATAAFANQLRETDWARLTGASAGQYSVRTIGTLDRLVEHFENGGAGVRTTWADGGHYFVLSGARWEDGALTVDQDDSLRRSRAVRSETNPRPNGVAYEPSMHTRFWTLERR
jgi:hypothetical protein